jgi:hypothetical protein
MVTLDYRLVPQANDVADRALDSASEDDIRYRLFLGDVVFRVGEADFSAIWGWVPVLDFAMGLEHVVRDLLRGHKEAEFEFTESDSTIRFERDEGDVFVSATYAPRRAVVTLETLAGAVRTFRTQVLNDLLMAHPTLRLNATVRRLLEGSA